MKLVSGQIMQIEIDDEIYLSRIHRVTDDHIVIDAPLSRGRIVSMEVGSRLKAWLIADTALYEFYAEVEDKDMGHLPTITLERPKESRRIQRRNYVRLPVRLLVHFTYAEELEDIVAAEGNRGEQPNLFPDSGQVSFYAGYTRDLSGGGLSLETNVDLEREQRIYLQVFLPDDREVRMQGVVIRVGDYLTGKKIITREYGVAFYRVDEKERDKIIRYIFEEQRERRQRGLI